jgi:hypothetical protein
MSFGGICMGSLLVDPVRVVYNVIYAIRYCTRGLFANCTDPLLKYLEPVSRWAYISMGVHGDGFLPGGKHSMNIFHSRGYTTIIPDQADTILFMVDFSVGFWSGLYFAIMAVLAWDPRDSAYEFFSFSFLAFVLGLTISMTFFSMIGVAVKTVTLCFLEFPHEFKRNHPHLYDVMNDAWHREYPPSPIDQ